MPRPLATGRRKIERTSDPSSAVFLSYASQDTEAAARLAQALRAAGIEVWFGQSELRGGDVWDAAIRRQIKACALFVTIISNNTHARGEGYFRLEWKLAGDRSHLMAADQPFLVPVVVDNVPDADPSVPERFREVQWTKLAQGDTPPAFVERIKRLLEWGVTPSRIAAEPAALADFKTSVPGVATITQIKKWIQPGADLSGYEPVYDGLRLAGVAD